MINILIKRKNNVITNINIEGHAQFDDYGKDIVCAGVSASVITTVNAIISFNENAIKYSYDNNFYLENILKDNITNKLLDNLYETLKSIEEKYKNNINIKED